MTIRFSIIAYKQLRDLPLQISERIVSKLKWYVAQDDPLHFAKPLFGHEGKFRFRIGNYRAIVTADGTVLVVLQVQKRSEVYRKR